MPRHARILADSGVYHVMLRGVNRDALFIENGDYARFLHALSLTGNDTLIWPHRDGLIWPRLRHAGLVVTV